MVIAAIALAGVLQARLDLLGRLGDQECRTVLCCEECPALRVSRVIDGDTFDSSAGRVRLFGVDTPERDEKCYAEASRRLSRLAGNEVRVEAGPRSGDGNRLLFYVYTKNGESIEELLIQEVRRLGAATMNQWASQAEKRVSQELKEQDSTIRSRKKKY